MADDAPAPPSLTIPPTLDPVHAALLREHHFETAGTLAEVIGDDDEYRGVRTLYAVTNPARTALVYVGDSEVGRDLYARLRDHLSRRAKAGHIERDSLVFVHVMVTEFLVLSRFEAETGALPLLNVVKTQKNARKGMRINGRERLIADEQSAARRVMEEKHPPKRSTSPRGREIVLLNPPKGTTFIPDPPRKKRKPKASAKPVKGAAPARRKTKRKRPREIVLLN